MLLRGSRAGKEGENLFGLFGKVAEGILFGLSVGSADEKGVRKKSKSQTPHIVNNTKTKSPIITL